MGPMPLHASNPFVNQFPGMQPAQGAIYTTNTNSGSFGAQSAPPRIEWSPRIIAIEEELCKLQQKARAPAARTVSGVSGPSATPWYTGVTLGTLGSGDK